MDDGIAILFNEHPCGLVGHIKLSKDISIVIIDVAEADVMPNNEIVH